ncbi:hypothetical protein [Thalassococcus sp. S3]|uniref:hypothetical protein n=1 Tax=Thalassococcus sp. S3 TaxID=2017482 RepID=UPI00102430F5|nr:hypothetical protein [Thalassococcus sp. S3]QBF30749.1 hypothetical protein CFI11_05890 [Thalassococcus sp. S3]
MKTVLTASTMALLLGSAALATPAILAAGLPSPDLVQSLTVFGPPPGDLGVRVQGREDEFEDGGRNADVGMHTATMGGMTDR